MDKIGRRNGNWPVVEIKLQIVKIARKRFEKILANQPSLKHDYIDAFAGAGLHISKSTKEPILGSPLNALFVEPPFDTCI